MIVLVSSKIFDVCPRERVIVTIGKLLTFDLVLKLVDLSLIEAALFLALSFGLSDLSIFLLAESLQVSLKLVFSLFFIGSCCLKLSVIRLLCIQELSSALV